MSLTAIASAPTTINPNQTFTVNVTLTSTGTSTVSQAKLTLPNGISGAVSPCYRPGQSIGVADLVIPFQITLFDQDPVSQVIRMNGEFLLADGSACNLKTELLLTLQPSPQTVPAPPDAARLLFDRIYQDDSVQLALGHLAWLC